MMFDFGTWLDLPLIWGVLVAVAVFMYVWLDGFDLGVGILFPFAGDHKERARMMNAIAPFWDANETWLVLGGGGLFVAFPKAYAILLPALYLPVILMLLGLICRGVAFEFRFKSDTAKSRAFWDATFHFGSLFAALMQGIILGNFVQGVEVANGEYGGGPLDWANGFALLTGIAVIFGYALLGATWIVMKSDGKLQSWARQAARYILLFVVVFMGVVSLSMPFIDTRIAELWFSLPNFFLLLPVPLLTLGVCIWLWKDLNRDIEIRPFILAMVLFLLGYIGLGISLWPWIVPFEYTLWDAAAASTSLSLLLVGALLMLPIILAYTAYCYWIFRGKSSEESMY